MGREEVYCVCRSPDDGSLMVECNYCAEWYHVICMGEYQVECRFHIKCIGMMQEDLKALSEYKCDACKPKPPAVDDGGGDGIKKASGKHTGPKADASGTKRRKGSQRELATIQKDEGETAMIRRKVVEGLGQTLRSFHPEIDADLSSRIEEALYEAFREARPKSESVYCGPTYKAKYRSLLFNLKEPKNDRLRHRLMVPEGDAEGLTPRQLVQLRPEEMANEELALFISQIKEHSMEQAMMGEAEKDGFIKKTHKGEEVMSIFASVDASPYLASMSAPLDLSALPPGASPEDIAAPSTAASLSSPESSMSSRIDAQFWFGRVLLQDVASFEAVAVDLNLAFNPLLGHIIDALPANMHITGRLAPARGLAYLSSVRAQGSRDIFMFRLDPVAEAETTVLGPGRLSRYLGEADRWAVIAHGPGARDEGPRAIRDLYIVPVSGLIRHQEAVEGLGVLSETQLAQVLFGEATRQSFVAFLVTSKHHPPAYH